LNYTYTAAETSDLVIKAVATDKNGKTKEADITVYVVIAAIPAL